MESLGIPLEWFNLDEREFERSKSWANIMKRYSVEDSGDEVDFDNLDRQLVDDNSDDDIEDIIRLDIEDENDGSPFDQSVSQLRSFSNTLARSQSRRVSKRVGNKGIQLPFVEDEEEDLEEDDDLGMQSLLDQTIPKLVERKRKWKESGMLRVLNTFDEEKIERTVGSWLRRNSSASASTFQSEKFEREDEDENDSLHSIDTARYVLSNRKPRSVSNFCNSTTIKAYRRLQSKRDALREKYAFPEDELDREVIERSKMKKRQLNGINTEITPYARTREINECRSLPEKGLGLRQGELLRVKHRRKYLSKETLRKWCLKRRSWEFSSSDEENDRGHNCVSEQRKRHAIRGRSLTSFIRRPNVFPPARLHFIPYATLHKKRTKSTLDLIASKPRKRESDCSCHNKKKLCHRTEHLADTSTEDWLVEDCNSPKKLLKGSSKCTVPEANENELEFVELKGSTAEKVQEIKAGNKKKCTKTGDSSPPITRKRSLAKKSKKTDENPTTKYEGESSFNTTFEKEFQLAVKLSKEMHKIELRRNKHKATSNKNKEQGENEAYIDKSDDDLKQVTELSEQDHGCTENSNEEEPIENISNEIEPSNRTKQEEIRNMDKIKNGYVIEESTTLNNGKLNKTLSDTPVKIANKTLNKTRKAQSVLPIIHETKAEHVRQQPLAIGETPTRPETHEEDYFIKRRLNLEAIETKPRAEKGNNKSMDELPNIENFSPNEFGLKPQPKSLKIKKFKKLLERSRSTPIVELNETFLSNAEKIRNSTAFKLDVDAVRKQISTEGPAPSALEGDEKVVAKVKEMRDENDCFIVSSTTDDHDNNNEQSLKSSRDRRRKEEHINDILIYNPHNRDSVPAECISDGVLNLTEEYLSSFIGKKLANKFMKYYTGCRRFDANLTVYYRHPCNNSLDNDDETDSDVDELERLDRYGELQVSFED